MLTLYTSVVLSFLHNLKVCESIVVTEVEAPPVIQAGGYGDFECRWNLSPGEDLYSVKWYHGLEEIYRFTPSKRQAVQIFKNRYLGVDPVHSWQGRVRVANVSLDAEGLFRCEVSGEAPAFYTDYGTINITVVSLPKEGPVIRGIRADYQVGDWIDLTCSTPESKPAARIRFHINGKTVPKEWLDKPVPRATTRGRSSISQRIYFPIITDIITREGVITVQCDSEIPNLHRRSTQIHLAITGPYLASVMDSDSSANRQQILGLILLSGITLLRLQMISWHK